MSLLSNQHQEERPWGLFERFTLNETTTVKILHVAKDQQFSLQKHSHRGEFWKVVAGNGVARIGDEERDVQVGDEIEIPVGTLHRLKGGSAGISVLEISFGNFEENDIERLEDDYGRS